MDWKDILRQVAPTIAGALTAGNPLVFSATKVLANKLLGKEDATLAEIANEIVTNPEALAKARDAENQFKLAMRRLGIEEQKVQNEDRDSARNREIKIKDKTPGGLAIFLTVGFFGSLGGLFYFEIPEANKAIVYSMIGSLGTGWITMLAYYYGSSAKEATRAIFNRKPKEGDK